MQNAGRGEKLRLGFGRFPKTMRTDADFKEFYFIFSVLLLFFWGFFFFGRREKGEFSIFEIFGDVESDGASWPRGFFRNFAVV